jgi:hypothetical protein
MKKPKRKVDMSSEAIDRRIRRVSQSRALCLSLSQARPVDRPEKKGAP